jgi:chemotaxis protein CheX
MANLSETDLRLFVDSIKHYLKTTTRQEPQITSAFLGTGDVQGFEFNGIVSFSGSYNGHVVVSMPARMLRELLLFQHETDMSDSNLLDAVGEIANTRVRKHPFVITLRWNSHEAMVCVDMEKQA